jgi:membrane protein implicated in regulation of membrane protease activity
MIQFLRLENPTMENHPSLSLFFGTAAGLGGILFGIRLILFFLGAGDQDIGGGDGSIDAGASDSSFEFISLQGVAGFFMMFGLVGLALLSGNLGVWVALGGATASGLFTLWLVGMLFRGMRRMQSDGTMRISNAIGQEGTVYLSIPADGTGQVQVSVQGGLKIFNAVAANHERIPTGSSIRVVKIISSNILMVEKIENV